MPGTFTDPQAPVPASCTAGLYDKLDRVWRVKSKHSVCAIASYDLDGDGVPELISGWSNGRVGAGRAGASGGRGGGGGEPKGCTATGTQPSRLVKSGVGGGQSNTTNDGIATACLPLMVTGEEGCPGYGERRREQQYALTGQCTKAKGLASHTPLKGTLLDACHAMVWGGDMGLVLRTQAHVQACNPR